MKYKQIDGNRQNLPKSWTLKDGSQTGNFDLLPESVHNDEGWYQCLDDPVVATPATHKLGFDTLVGNKWQRAVIEKTQEELDAFAVSEAARLEAIAQQEILDLKKDSQYILALVGRDNAWVDTKIDNGTGGSTNAEIIENIRTMFKEIVYTQRDVAEILAALYKLGRI